MDYTLNCNGRLLSLKEPQVMGIMNVTPDSFYANSRKQTEEDIVRRTEEILAQGGSIIDIGACSTRPGSEPKSISHRTPRSSPSHHQRRHLPSPYSAHGC